MDTGSLPQQEIKTSNFLSVGFITIIFARMPFSKISLKLFPGKIILPFIVSLLLINNLGYNCNMTFQRVQLQFNKPCGAFEGKVP